MQKKAVINSFSKSNLSNKVLFKDKSGSIWGITVFFNPGNFKNKIENYHRFSKSVKNQGLNLLAIELTFGGKFELSEGDADLLVKIKGDKENILWQKERLLNVALRHLPKDCDKIVWLDCDIIFEKNDWVKETEQLLLKYVVVQPFSKGVRLGKDVFDYSSNYSLNRGVHSSFPLSIFS